MPKTLTDIIAEKVLFLEDDRGRRTHAVLSLEDYEELLSDLEGVALTLSRRSEGSISIEEAKRRSYDKPKVWRRRY